MLRGDKMSEKLFKIMKDYQKFIKANPHYEEFESAIAKALSTAQLSESSVIVDLGFGHGHTTKALIEYGIKGIIKAIDINPDMLSIANANLGEYISTGKVELIHEDITKYLKSLDHNSISAVVSGLVLHSKEKPERQEICNLIYNVLQHNGIFVNGDKYAIENHEEYERLFMERIKSIEKVLHDNPKLRDYWLKDNYNDNLQENRLYEKEFMAMLKDIGFSKVDTTYRKELEAVVRAVKTISTRG